MGARSWAWIACASALLAPVAAAADPAKQDAPPACPWPVTLWVVSDAPSAEGEWRFEYLELYHGIARRRGLQAWLAEPEISDSDARWFVSEPPRAVPTFVGVTSLQASFDEIPELCAALAAAGAGVLQDAAGETCARSGGDGAGGARTSLRQDNKLYGMRVGPRIDDERCSGEGNAAEELPAGTVLSVVFDVADEPADGEAEDPAAAAARAVIASWSSFVAESAGGAGGPRGLASLPPARAMIDLLMDLDPEVVPEALRSDLHLAIGVGAARGYTVALAAESLAQPLSRVDLLSTLLYLGERAAPDARDALVMLLRRTDDDREVTALALRALLEADPAAARLEALRLLDAPGGAPAAAIGVFARTGAGYRSDLERLDLSDPEAVAGVAASIIGHLAASESDLELRRAAARILERRAAGLKRD